MNELLIILACTAPLMIYIWINSDNYKDDNEKK